MKYYVAFDGGGTKLAAILFDENLRPVSRARSGSMNTAATQSREVVEKNAEECARALLKGTGIEEIECVYGVFNPTVADGLKKAVRVNRLEYRGGESVIGIYSAFVFDTAVVALAGTGSVIFAVRDGECFGEAGGYGAIVHDEGSGYHLGRLAFSEAVKDAEGRGEHTLITQKICDKLGEDNLWSAMSRIYDHPALAPIPAVASVATCVGDAAREGDEIAKRLLRQIGENLADQANGLIKRLSLPTDVPIVLCGGIYKNHLLVSESFKNAITDGRKVILPYFEPIVGAVMCHWCFAGKIPDEAEISRLKEDYADYRFIIKQ